MDKGLHIDAQRALLAVALAFPYQPKLQLLAVRYYRQYVGTFEHGDEAALRKILGEISRRNVSNGNGGSNNRRGRNEDIVDWHQIDKILCWAEKPHNDLIFFTDARYPRLLTEIPTPPLVLFVAGELSLLSRPQIAFVGSRKASRYGREISTRLASEAGRRGFVTTSGLAMGIDGVVHSASIKSRFPTIAVLGCGIDRIYPQRHRQLRFDILETGLLVSEFPLGAPPLAFHFPRRNRVISGLSIATVVVEAAEKSGSLITAKHALEQGRDVFAVPGPITSLTSSGCHRLIRDGASIIYDLEQFFGQVGDIAGNYQNYCAAPSNGHVLNEKDEIPSSQPISDPRERRILQLLASEPISIDEFCERSGLTAPEVSSILIALEIKGYACAVAGNGYVKAS